MFVIVFSSFLQKKIMTSQDILDKFLNIVILHLNYLIKSFLVSKLHSTLNVECLDKEHFIDKIQNNFSKKLIQNVKRSKLFCTYLFGQIVSLSYGTLLVVFTDDSDWLTLGLTRFLLKISLIQYLYLTNSLYI